MFLNANPNTAFSLPAPARL